MAISGWHRPGKQNEGPLLESLPEKLSKSGAERIAKAGEETRRANLLSHCGGPSAGRTDSGTRRKSTCQSHVFIHRLYPFAKVSSLRLIFGRVLPFGFYEDSTPFTSRIR